MNGSQQYIAVKEFAALCGVSEKTIRRRVCDGSIPSYQPGGPKTRIFIALDALNHTGIFDSSKSAPVNNTDRGNAVHSQSLPGPKPRWKT